MRKRDAWVGIGAALIGAVTWIGLDTAARATNHEPANKAGAAASTVEVGKTGEELVLLSETVKTSSPADLLLAATLECSIITDVKTVGNETTSATARMVAWVEIDGEPVTLGGGDNGEVVFCDRTYARTTSLFDDTNATIETFFRTRSTHGFNWVAFDTGAATHTIELVGMLEADATENGRAEIAVGNRTLVVEPLKMANDETSSTTTTTSESSGLGGILGAIFR